MSVVKVCVMNILDELGMAGFAWHEYPTLVDAIERHVEAALTTPNQTNVTVTYLAPQERPS
jgi:hypothetical protein